MSTIVEHDSIRYRVQVSVGSDRNNLRILNVNDDAHPVLINSDEFVGQVTYRIRGQDQIQGYKEGQQQDGLAIVPDSPWFFQPDRVAGKETDKNKKEGGNNHICSLQIQGRFKREWTGDQIVFATIFDRPLKLPALASAAVRFFKTLDSGLQVDVQGPQPYFISPLLASMNRVCISSRTSSVDNSVPVWPSSNGEHIAEDIALALETTAASTKDPEEKNVLQKTLKKLTSDAAARRHYFAKTKNAIKHKFHPDHEYGLDLFNGFFDCAKFSVKLPGFSIDMFKYLDGQPITYAIRTHDASVTFLIVVIDLVPVQSSSLNQSLSDI
ncbi:hypothetical protein BGZ83_006421 [Gryganskiella cystojenkinii]|nr:hypothetical protein BGZ83_006421 [Gryganskiella cystojenkinii]